MLPENMHRRKIQLIAGTTYTLSLPKEWVKKNNLKEKEEVMLSEKNDRTLVISPELIEDKELNEISINIEDYIANIDQILFAIYYLGVENINLFSKKDITKDVKTRIRKALKHMTGIVVSYEDKQKMTIRVLFDKSKAEINQLIYRISLIIELSIKNILEQPEMEEIQMNEDEIDRLFHLMTKIVSLSLVNSSILQSSKIDNVSHIPSYFLIGKRLENIGDNIYHLSGYLMKNKADFENKKLILEFIMDELGRSVKYINSKSEKIFEKISQDSLRKVYDAISKIKDKTVSSYLEDSIRYLADIEEEIVNISFYNQLIHENKL